MHESINRVKSMHAPACSKNIILCTTEDCRQEEVRSSGKFFLRLGNTKQGHRVSARRSKTKTQVKAVGSVGHNVRRMSS